MQELEIKHIIPYETLVSNESEATFRVERLHQENNIPSSYTHFGLYYRAGNPSFEITMILNRPHNLTSIKIFSKNAGGYEATKDFELYGITKDNKEELILKATHEDITTDNYIEYPINEYVGGHDRFIFKVLNVHDGNGGENGSIARLCLYGTTYDVEENTSTVCNHNASLTYTLPMNTTEKILSKQKDHRVGLLGMANDGDNFGDLYVVGRDGKAHLTKSGIKSEILFEGNASVLNEKYVLSKPITDFKMLVFFSNASSSTSSGFNTTSVVVNVDDIKYINNEFYVNLYQGGYERNFNFTIHNDNISFSITRQTLGGLSSMQITKVIGIY